MITAEPPPPPLHTMAHALVPAGAFLILCARWPRMRAPDMLHSDSGWVCVRGKTGKRKGNGEYSAHVAKGVEIIFTDIR